jgi:hypothetical protein
MKNLSGKEESLKQRSKETRILNSIKLLMPHKLNNWKKLLLSSMQSLRKSKSRIWMMKEI